MNLELLTSPSWLGVSTARLNTVDSLEESRLGLKTNCNVWYVRCWDYLIMQEEKIARGIASLRLSQSVF